MCVHIIRICISYVALSSVPSYFFFYFFAGAICQSVRDVRLCDVTCLFLLSEKRQGSMDSPSKSET